MALAESNQSDEFAAAMESRASSFVDSCQQIMQLDYDYSPKTLQIMDQALAVYHPQGFAFETGWHSHAAYAGEVVRRALGGKWVKEENGSGASLRGVAGKATIYPFLWVSKRIDAVVQGSDENSLALKYVKLLQMLDRESEAPERLPDDWVRKHAEQMSGEESSQAVAASGSQDSEAEDDGDADDDFASALAMAPTVCFFLVAAADGNIDKKEAKSFLSEVIKYATHPNPLIREVFGTTPSKFAEFCTAITESAPLAVMKLALCRIAAEQRAPEHAAEFCQALLKMSTAIASSSGGLFSRGKVSKDERQALDVIAQTLGLKDK
ncbi:MAG: hypothetical protein ACTHK7_04550 [Aureliella sp.]